MSLYQVNGIVWFVAKRRLGARRLHTAKEKRQRHFPNDMWVSSWNATPIRCAAHDIALYLETISFDEQEQKYSELVPDLAVEVISPNDRWNKMQKRIRQFLTKGVKMVWFARSGGLLVDGVFAESGTTATLEERRGSDRLWRVAGFLLQGVGFLYIDGSDGMNWEIIWSIVAIVIAMFAAWSLMRVLGARQASDRSYDGYDGYTEGGPGDGG